MSLALPDFSNQTPNTLTFNQVVALDDVRPIARLKLKRRFVGSTDGLVNYWRLNGDATDSIGAKDGSTTGVVYEDGLFGKSGSFTGTASYIVFNDAFNFTSENFSAFAWVNLNSGSTVSTIYYTGRANIDGWTLDADYTTKKLLFRTNQSGAIQVTSSNDVLTIGAWSHIGVTREGGTAKLYYNGVEETLSSGVHIDPVAGSYSRIGGYGSVPTSQIPNMLIEDCRTYNVALSANEVLALYNDGAGVIAGSANNYDGDWTTITSYVLEDGLGNVEYGIDDQPWIQGVTRIGALDLVFDNSNRKFNDQTDENSLWYDSVTTYYIPNSLIELEMGYELPTGTQYYSDEPYHSGLMRLDNIRYSMRENTFECSIMSKLEWLKTINISDVYTITNTDAFTAINLVDKIYNYLENNSPIALGLSSIANSPRNDVFYSDIDQFNPSTYDFIQSIARQTGSLFGINRSGEAYLTYFGNPYYSNTNTTFINTNTTGYYLFDSGSIGVTIADSSGLGNDMYTTGTLTGVHMTLTTGKFGTGKKFNTNRIGGYDLFNTRGYIGYQAPMNIGEYSYETLVKFENKAAGRSIKASFDHGTGTIYYNDTGLAGGPVLRFSTRTGTDHITLGMDYDGFFSFDAYQYGVAFSATARLPMPKRFEIGEDLWYYMAVTNSVANGTRNLYINGTRIYSDDYPWAASGTFVILNPGYCVDTEYDSLKVSNVALTQEEISQNSARIFGNKFEWSSQSTYSFYNYGSSKNILEIEDYNNGYSRIYNKIIIPNPTELYKTVFGITQVAGHPLYSVDTGNYAAGFLYTSITAFKDTINSGFDGMYCTLTADEITVYLETTTFRQASRANILFTEDSYGTTVSSTQFSLTTTKDYASIGRTIESGEPRSVRFRKVKTQGDYVFQDTTSIEQYGVKEYKLEQDDNLTDDLTQTAIIANAILENYATPKVRMGLKTRFLEGDLDLFGRVTVNWRPDSSDRAFRWDADLFDTDTWAEEAGAIMWGTKDFWVIGITHNYNDQETIYRLREV